jgi:Right handed beta helix region/Putative Ig domain/Dockerin type I domain
MANLAALLDAYDLDPGDIIHVDAGTYDLLRNITISVQDSGVTILGPQTGVAVFNRGNQSNGSYAIQFAGADDVTISRLSLTGAETGIYLPSFADSDRITLSNLNIFGNSNSGVYLERFNDDLRLLDSRVHDNAEAGVNLNADNALVSNSEIFANSIGIQGSGYFLDRSKPIRIQNNQIHDNRDYGIRVDTNSRVEGNTVFNHRQQGQVGILVGLEISVSGNTIFDNFDGIRTDSFFSWGTVIEANRIFHNVSHGILAGSDMKIRDNIIYSNSIGIEARSDSYSFSGEVINNLVYSNSNTGLRVAGVAKASVFNNTIYQPVGDAIQVVGNSTNVLLRNNILWVESGYDINVSDDSQVGFSSDYNLLHQGLDANAHAGRWGSQILDSLQDWTVTSTQDTNAIAGNPGFIDFDGSDNILGYTTNAGGVHGGDDDNFYRSKHSIAIDAGDLWNSPILDIDGFTRRDDPGTVNTGSKDYETVGLGGSTFAATGTGQNWNGYGSFSSLSLPFAFRFYGGTYSNVEVSSAGFLKFAGAVYPSPNNSLEQLQSTAMIAPLWDDLHTNGSGDDVFVDASTSGQVTIRWDATNAVDNSDVNFSVTLFEDGRIRFDYGSGNTGLSPTIGISRGDDRFFVQPAYDGRADLTNVNSIEFQLTRSNSYVDIGAFEFRGSSLDDTPPTVSNVAPAFIADGGTAESPFSTIAVTFSEEVNPIDARATANYELRHPGLDGVFDNADDIVFTMRPSYDAVLSQTLLTITDTRPLVSGQYRFTVFDRVDGSIHDLAGLRLDGDTNAATNFSSFVRQFSLANQSPKVEPINGQTIAEGSLLSIQVTASDNDLHDVLTYSLEPGSPDGASINPSTGLFTWTPGESFGGSTYPVSVRVTDSGTPAKNATRTFNVSVIDTNLAPTLNPIGNKTVAEGTTLQFTALAVDADIPIDTLTFSLIGAPSSATINPSSGQFVWTPVESDGPGTFVFTVRVTDNGNSPKFAQEQITVTVAESNSPPQLQSLSNRSVRVNERVSFAAQASDADIPVNQLRFSLDAGAPAGATIDPVTGVFEWTPADDGDFAVTVRVTDNGTPVLSTAQSINIKVFPINIGPQLTVNPNQLVAEGTTLNFTATATDGNAKDILTFTLIGAPSGATIDTATGVFSWTPTEAQGPNVYTVKVRVTDNGSPSLFDERDVQIAVGEINQAPILDPIAPKIFSEGSERQFAIFARDADLPANALRFELIGAPQGATIDAVTGIFSWNPSEAQGPGTFSTTVRVTDNGSPALFAEQQMVLIVNEVNLPPVIDPIANRTSAVGSVVRFAATASDPDIPANQLRFSLINAPTGATIDPITGQFEWQPNQTGAFTFSVRVTDDGPVNLFHQTDVTITAVATTVTTNNATITGNVLSALTNSGTYGALSPESVSLSASLGTVVKSPNGTWSWSLTSSVRLVNQPVTITASDGFSSSSVSFNVDALVNVSNLNVYYKGSSFSQSGNNVAAALDTTKTLAKSGNTTQTLSYANLINTTRGINGLVLDVAGLTATSLTSADFLLRLSPTGLFNEAANPPASWVAAPTPSGIFVTPGNATTASRVRIEWADNAIANRWLQIQVRANVNTGLPQPAVFYIGHLQGEVDGRVLGGAFFVTTQDQSAVLPLGIANVTTIRDLDKNGFVTTQDLTAVRNSISAGRTLRVITIPVAGSTNEGTAIESGGGSSLNREDQGNIDELETSLSLLSSSADISVWHNKEMALDADGDGLVTQHDALLVVREINARGSGLLGVNATPDLIGKAYVDVNADGLLSPIDALLIADYIKQTSALAAISEGEQIDLVARDAAFADSDWILEQSPGRKRKR